MIDANCRNRFTADDFEFIAAVFARDGVEQSAVVKMLTNESARDELLDDQRLLEALRKLARPLPVSTRLYFYVLVRHALLGKGVNDRAVADYVANLLAEFARADLVCTLGEPGKKEEYHYVVDLLEATENAPPDRVFLIHLHIGNYLLFITGVFPDRVRYWVRTRGAPGIEFYEGVGISSYRLASSHQLARRHALTEVCRKIAGQFRDIRLALNRISDSLLHRETLRTAETEL